MRAALTDLIRRQGVLGLALIVAVGLGAHQLARQLGFVVMQLPGLNRDLSVVVAGTRVRLDELASETLAVALVLLALWLVWRFGARRSRLCPDCLSEIPPAATVCRYCTAELGEGTS